MIVRIVLPSVILPSIEYLRSEIINCATIARISRGKRDLLTFQKSEEILRRILKMKPFPHESILEHSKVTIYIRGSRIITHQLVRHRFFSPTQISTRYVQPKREVILIDPTLGKEAPFRGNTDDPNWTEISSLFARYSYQGFNNAENLRKNRGWTREQARYLFPQCLAADIIISANFREWRHAISLRDHKNASPEIQYIFKRIREYFRLASPTLLEGVYGENHDPDELLKEALDFFESEMGNWPLLVKLREYFGTIEKK